MSIDYSLITPERTAKLELLHHLINNSNRTIVLCGSEGVGKTTLLNAFLQQTESSWLMLLIQGKDNLTLEQIKDRLLENRPKTQTLVDLFDDFAAQQRKAVLLIDNAGYLAPYLVTELIDFVAQHTMLRLVLVLTHDELAVKTYSDSQIEDSHIIEIAPLTQAQCADFLQHLAIKTTLNVPKQVTDDMIAWLYQQTHGIPAKIIAELPVLARPKPSNQRVWLLLLLMFAFIALLFVFKNSVNTLLQPLIDRLHP